ncbi:MAG: site-specific integrase [Blastocatellia bacterium]
MRRGEALGLRWSDVDLDGRTLRVGQSLQRLNGQLVLGETKTEQSRRVITIPLGAVSALREYRTRQREERMKLGPDWQDTGLVFTTQWGTPIDPRNVKRAFDTLLDNAELPHMRLHDLRHAWASWLLAEGVDLKTISTILGHSSIRVTADVYAHVNQQQISAAMNRLDQAIGKSH